MTRSGERREKPRGRGRNCVLRLLVVIAMAAPASAFAYIGPGAGFAFLSSFFTLFLAFLYALFAILLWPVKWLVRAFRHRGSSAKAKIPRAVIVGLDGFDPELAERFMKEGKMPNLARMKDQGTFLPLATTCPPISPVAWSTFLTGVNPGKHNVYDFLARDSSRYLPYLSSAQIRGPRRSLRVGKYSVPIGRPEIKLLRKGIPFWHYLGDAGVSCSVIRVPITFPPEKFSGVLLSGMFVPDLQGSQGTYTFFTSAQPAASRRAGGVNLPLEKHGRFYRASIPGPDNPLRRGTHLHVPFTIHPEPGGEAAELRLQGRRIGLRKRVYSEWVELKFKAAPGFGARGICRFYLKQVAPDLELYVSPVNIHPGKPALPISHPFAYSIYLAKLLGPFATLGLAEDTWALNEGVLDDDAFLEQCYLNHQEREQMFLDALEKTSRGLCICVFDITDRIQHMFWRYFNPDHAAVSHDPADQRFSGVIEDLYRRMDAMVGRIQERIGESLLLVISDHGFKSFERGLNLNSWLLQNGYLVLNDGARASGEWFDQVDWQRTRAYAMGLNGLYVNQKGRERIGIVAAGEETVRLKEDLRTKLCQLADPATGRPAILAVHDSQRVYKGPYRENAPDLIIGYGEGYRASWDSVSGKATDTVFEDNCKAWSGDHCVDPSLVPGVLFANRRFTCPSPHIADIAPTLLDLFGLPVPRHFDGKAWTLTPERAPQGES